MNHEEVMRWLAAWRVKSILSCLLGAVGGLALSLVLLALAWAFLFMVSLQVIGRWIPYSDNWIHPLVATAAIPFLFIGNAFISKESLGKYAPTTGTSTNKLVTLPGYGSNVNPLATNTIISVLKVIGDILFCGPRVTVWSFGQIRRAFRLLWLDVTGCSAVLAVLNSTGHRMSYQDIASSIDGLNCVRVFNQLRLLEGVLFLE